MIVAALSTQPWRTDEVKFSSSPLNQFSFNMAVVFFEWTPWWCSLPYISDMSIYFASLMKLNSTSFFLPESVWAGAWFSQTLFRLKRGSIVRNFNDMGHNLVGHLIMYRQIMTKIAVSTVKFSAHQRVRWWSILGAQIWTESVLKMHNKFG